MSTFRPAQERFWRVPDTRSSVRDKAAAGVRRVRVDQITTDERPWCGRHHLDARHLDDLRRSLRETGRLDNPLTLRVHPGRPGRYQLIAGEYRHTAAQLEGWTWIEAQVIEASDEAALRISLDENRIQAGNELNLEKAWLAAAMKRLRRKEGRSHDYRTLARVLGYRSPGTVDYHLQIAHAITPALVEEAARMAGTDLRAVLDLPIRALKAVAEAPEGERVRLLETGARAYRDHGRRSATSAVEGELQDPPPSEESRVSISGEGFLEVHQEKSLSEMTEEEALALARSLEDAAEIIRRRGGRSSRSEPVQQSYMGRVWKGLQTLARGVARQIAARLSPLLTRVEGGGSGGP